MKLQTLAGALGAATFLAAATSAQGYVATPITNNFTDISASGASLLQAGIDDGGAVAPIGFSFNFYGNAITSIAGCTNGYMTTGADLTDFSPDCPAPDAFDPNGMIAPFFDDLSLTDHGEIYYQTLGSAPNRLFIMQWEDAGGFLASQASLTFQVQLFETAGNIQFHYENLVDTTGGFAVGGDEAFIGLENDTGTVATEIACEAGAPVLASNDAYDLQQLVPQITAPAEVVSGTLFNVPGLADAGTFYVYAYDTTPGPLGPIPLLEGITLDLGINFKLAGAGLTPASGVIASDNILTPSGFGGTVVYWQVVTIAGFGPISGVKKSNSDSTLIQDGANFTGTLPVAGVADEYQMPGTAGDVVTIRLCRTDNTGGAGSTLDPYLCLVDPTGVVEVTDDDSAGDCFVTGPFGASEIVGHTLLATGTYSIYATAFQGTTGADATGDYDLTIIGPQASSTVLATDDGPLCPGQPLTNPAGKLGLSPISATKRR